MNGDDAQTRAPQPDAEQPDLARELVRTADRLRVVGPRLATSGTARSLALLAGVRATVQALADLAADAEGRPRLAVPALDPHALADQVLVLGRDVHACADASGRTAAARLLTDLRRDL